MALSNKEIAAEFKFLAQLMELHNENPFKIKSYLNAAFKIERLDLELWQIPQEEIEKLEGIGNSTASKIVELLKHGQIFELQKIAEKTPDGVIEMLSIKGIGPKKIAVIWKELEIESLGELLYACNENRLVELKGFGAKTQESIRKNIEYLQESQNKYHYAKAESVAFEYLKTIKSESSIHRIAFTGALRRKTEVIEKIELIIEKELDENAVESEIFLGIPVEIKYVRKADFVKEWFLSTGSKEHLDGMLQEGLSWEHSFATEEEIYRSAGMRFIEPELREGRKELSLAKANALPELINIVDLKGVLHVHSTYSDGIHTLKQMAEKAKSMGFQYMGISDHSQSAFYANGLKPERIHAQHLEIDSLNKLLTPFKIFKGIEADVLSDGRLDYDDEVLSSFDFVIASIHSNLKMNQEKATERLLKAIENPYTTLLGHLTGRLLLSREGYPVDHKKVIDACSRNEVVIELNAHPYRLDLDWRWIDYALSKGVKISINPDAHSMEGFNDMHYGVCVARKGGLHAAMTFNAMNLDEIDNYFQQKQLKRKV